MFFSFSLFCLEWRNLLIPFRAFWTERNSSRSTTRIYLFIYLALFVRIMKITYLRWCDDISFFFSKFSIKEAIQRSESTSLIILRRLRIFERVAFKNNGIQSIKSEKINLLFSPSHRLSPFFFFCSSPNLPLFLEFSKSNLESGCGETIGKKMEGRGGRYPDVSSRHRFFTLDLWLVLFYREQDKRRGCVGRGERLNSSNGSRKDDV